MKSKMDKDLKKVLTSVVFNNLRILHGVTKADTYCDNYRWHLDRCGGPKEFWDIHALAFFWGATHHPMRIIEIGARTGLSLAALLSAYIDFKGLRVVVFDLFDDGLSCPDLVKKHLAHLAIPSNFIEFRTGDSRMTVPEFKKSNQDKFDWILIDGGHSPEIMAVDLENVCDLVAKDGLLVVDDLSATMESNGFCLKPTWEKFKERHAKEFAFHEDLAAKGTGWGQCLVDHVSANPPETIQGNFEGDWPEAPPPVGKLQPTTW